MEKEFQIIIFGLFFIFSIILYPIQTDYINSLNFTSWSFLGHEALSNVILAIPLIFIIIATIVPIYFLGVKD